MTRSLRLLLLGIGTLGGGAWIGQFMQFLHSAAIDDGGRFFG